MEGILGTRRVNSNCDKTIFLAISNYHPTLFVKLTLRWRRCSLMEVDKTRTLEFKFERF